MNTLLFWLPWGLSQIFLIALVVLLIQFIRLRTRYLRETSRDQVSQLKTQIAILAELEKMFNIAVRYKHALTIGMLYQPQFRQLKREFGDAPFNDYIIKVAQILHQELRSTDRIGRFDFDKFLLILTNTNAHESRAVFNRIVARLDQLAFQNQNLNYHMGLTQLRHDTRDLNQFIAEAETALSYSMEIDSKNIQGHLM